MKGVALGGYAVLNPWPFFNSCHRNLGSIDTLGDRFVGCDSNPLYFLHRLENHKVGPYQS